MLSKKRVKGFVKEKGFRSKIKRILIFCCFSADYYVRLEYTLSNFTYNHLVRQKEKTENDATINDGSYETNVITGGTLSNYVQEQITYDYDLSTINEINKFRT